jgi:hypothetical protein
MISNRGDLPLMSQTTIDSGIRWKLLLPFLIFMAFSYSCMLIPAESVRKVLLWEDGVVETAGALFLLLASVFFLILFFRSEGERGWLCFGTRRNWFYLFLAFFFFVGAGEEISWGQHYLHYETPEFWKSRNVQQELTVHNLIYLNQREFSGEIKPVWQRILSVENIFTYGTLFYVFLLPVAASLNQRVRQWVERAGLPLAPLTLSWALLGYFAWVKVLKFFILPDYLMQNNTEIMESMWGLLYLLIALSWYGAMRRRAAGGSPA